MEYKELPAIYIFTNKTNGKVYVGETNNLKRRMSNYQYPNKNRPFELAIKKYGLDNFWLEYYYLPDFDKISLLDLEEATIKRFNSLTTGNGYNVCVRGDGSWGCKHTEETKQKISEANKGNKKRLGKTFSDESRKKMSDSRMGNTNSLGRVQSDKTKQKISEAKKGRCLTEEHRQKISEAQKIRLRKKSNND